MKSEIATGLHPEVIRVLKTDTCPSLSGKSKLTYHIGCKADEQIQLRVHGNTGKGYFSKEWVAFSSISQALSRVPKDKAITSTSFKGVFQGKSVNSAGFLLAVLKNEALIRPLKDKRRCYELLDATDFISEVKALMGSSTGTVAKKPAATPQKATKPARSPAIQKQPASTKAQKA